MQSHSDSSRPAQLAQAVHVVPGRSVVIVDTALLVVIVYQVIKALGALITFVLEKWERRADGADRARRARGREAATRSPATS